MIIHGDLTIHLGDETDRSLLTHVDGWLYICEGATLHAPALTRVGGTLDVRDDATLHAPALTSVGGWLDVRDDATLDAPALTRVRGRPIDQPASRRVRTRYVARLMTEPHGRCSTLGYCDAPKGSKCR